MESCKRIKNDTPLVKFMKQKWVAILSAIYFNELENGGKKELTLPQNEHVYFECWVISIFFTILRSEAP